MAKMPEKKGSDLMLALVCAVTYAAILFPLVSLPQVGGSSEAREVHIARIIHEEGNWLLPLRDGLLPSKPPLYHWLVAAAGHLSGGVNEVTARAVSLLLGAGLLFLVVYTALKFIHRDRYRVALTAALVLGTSYQFMRLSGDARVDMTFAFFACLALCFLIWPLSTSRERYSLQPIPYTQRDFIAFYLSCAAAILAKGPLGIVLPFLIGFAITVSFFGLKSSLRLWMSQRIGLYLFLIIAPIWYYLAYQSAGFEFIARHLFFENIERFAGGEKINNQPPWFYFISFLLKTIPWSVLFFYFLAAERTAAHDLDEDGKRLRKISLVWFFTGFIFFSIASGKRHSYLLPILPAMTLYLTQNIVLRRPFLTNESMEKLKDGLIYTLFVCALVFIVVPDIFEFPDPMHAHLKSWVIEKQPIFVSVCFLALAIKLCFNILKLGPVWRRDFLTTICIQLMLAFLLYSGIGIKAKLKDFQAVAKEVDAAVGVNREIVAVREKYEEFLDPLLYYLERDVVVVHAADLEFECGKHYLFHATAENGSLVNSEPALRIIKTFKLPIDRWNGEVDRDITLTTYTCSDFED